MMLDPVPPAIAQLADQLRAARATSPPLAERLQAAHPVPHSTAHLDDPDLLRRIGGDDVVALDSGEDAEPIEPIKRRKRKPTLTSVARQAAKARVAVAAYDVRPDGTIRVVIGKPGAVSVDLDDTIPDRSEWN